MTNKITIQAQPRSISGRASKQLRSEGILPAVVYGRGFEAISIQVPTKEFQRVFAEAGETTLVYLSLEKDVFPTIIHDVTVDAANDKLLHADFYKVRLDEKIKANIPVVIVGVSPAVKDFGGIMLKNISEIDVEGFPQDLPHQISIDVSTLVNLRDSILVKDIMESNTLVKSGKLKILTDPNDIIVLVQAPISEDELKEQLEASAPGAAADEVEVIKKEKVTEEGESASEDAPKTDAVKEKAKKN